MELIGISADERIFPIVPEAVQHVIKSYADKAGVKKIRVHDVRHSHCAYLIYRGVQPMIIKKRLGHKDIRITRKHFIPACNELEFEESCRMLREPSTYGDCIARGNRQNGCVVGYICRDGGRYWGQGWDVSDKQSARFRAGVLFEISQKDIPNNCLPLPW